MAADGFSRTSNRQRFGVVAIQSQAGAENAMGGIAQAYADNIPILVLPGGVRLSQIAVRPNFSASHTYRGWVKRVEAIYRPEDVGTVMRRAFHALRNGPAGPVVVEMTSDVCAEENTRRRRKLSLAKTHATGALDRRYQRCRHSPARGKKSSTLGGTRGSIFAGATDELKELVDLTGIPVFCTMPGKSAFDERHPLALGAGSGATTGPVHHWLKNCDVLLALGSSLTRTPLCPVRPFLQGTHPKHR